MRLWWFGRCPEADNQQSHDENGVNSKYRAFRPYFNIYSMSDVKKNEGNGGPKKHLKPPLHSGIAEQVHKDPNTESGFPNQFCYGGAPSSRLSDIISISWGGGISFVISCVIAG